MALDLAPTERMIWQGQPAQGIRLSPQDVFAIPFAALWLFMVSTIFLLTVASEAEDSGPIVYFALPVFILIGIYLLFGRFFVDRAIRQKTHYYLTNQRALIEYGLFQTSQISASFAALPELRFRADRRGRGTIQFGAIPVGLVLLPPSWPGARRFLPPTFEQVEDGERVFRLALEAQREAQARR